MDSVNSVAPPAASGMAGGGGSMGGAGPEQAAQFQNAMATPAETTSGQSAGSNGWNAGAGDVSQSGLMAGGATGQVGQSMLQMPNTDSASSGSMSQMPNTDSASSGSMPQIQNPDSAPSPEQNAGTQADTATVDGSAAAAGVVNGDLNGDGRYSKDEFIADVARYNEIQGILSSSGAQGSVISPEIQEELNPLLSRLASIDVTDFIGDKTVDLSRFA